MTRGSRREIGIVALAVVAMTAVSLAAVGLTGAARHRSSVPGWSTAACTTPALEGAVVDAALSNMGGPMMGGGGRPMGGMMRLRADVATVSHGTVSFVAVNIGSVNHELVALPLPDGQIAGTRPSGGDGGIDEAGSLGEASNSCGAGAGEGIAPSRSSWVTLTLAPGRYELVCNLPGHASAGHESPLTSTALVGPPRMMRRQLVQPRICQRRPGNWRDSHYSLDFGIHCSLRRDGNGTAIVVPSLVATSSTLPSWVFTS